MDTEQFLQSVELLAGLNRESARRAAQATLATLAERVGRPVATELAGGLPGELGAALTGGRTPPSRSTPRSSPAAPPPGRMSTPPTGATMPWRSWPLSART